MSRCKPDGSAWGERTIRNGSIRFYGKTYRVAPTERPAGFTGMRSYQSEPPYDGRLDGKRALFYRYSQLYTRLEDSVFLHSFPPYEPDKDTRDPNVIDGYIVWERWKEVE